MRLKIYLGVAVFVLVWWFGKLLSKTISHLTFVVVKICCDNILKVNNCKVSWLLLWLIDLWINGPDKILLLGSEFYTLIINRRLT